MPRRQECRNNKEMLLFVTSFLPRSLREQRPAATAYVGSRAKYEIVRCEPCLLDYSTLLKIIIGKKDDASGRVVCRWDKVGHRSSISPVQSFVALYLIQFCPDVSGSRALVSSRNSPLTAFPLTSHKTKKPLAQTCICTKLYSREPAPIRGGIARSQVSSKQDQQNNLYSHFWMVLVPRAASS